MAWPYGAMLALADCVFSALATAVSIASLRYLGMDMAKLNRQRRGAMGIPVAEHANMTLSADSVVVRMADAKRKMTACGWMVVRALAEDIPFFIINLLAMLKLVDQGQPLPKSLLFSALLTCISLGRKVEQALRFYEFRRTVARLAFVADTLRQPLNPDAKPLNAPTARNADVAADSVNSEDSEVKLPLSLFRRLGLAHRSGLHRLCVAIAAAGHSLVSNAGLPVSLF